VLEVVSGRGWLGVTADLCCDLMVMLGGTWCVDVEVLSVISYPELVCQEVEIGRSYGG
jgi:hypothetical protein